MIIEQPVPHEHFWRLHPDLVIVPASLCMLCQRMQKSQVLLVMLSSIQIILPFTFVLDLLASPQPSILSVCKTLINLQARVIASFSQVCIPYSYYCHIPDR